MRVQVWDGKATPQVFFVQKYILSCSVPELYPKTFIIFLYQDSPWSLPLETDISRKSSNLLEVTSGYGLGYPLAWQAYNLWVRDRGRKGQFWMIISCEVSLFPMRLTFEDGRHNISSLVLQVWPPRSVASALLQKLVEMQILGPSSWMLNEKPWDGPQQCGSTSPAGDSNSFSSLGNTDPPVISTLGSPKM